VVKAPEVAETEAVNVFENFEVPEIDAVPIVGGFK
jgi:hypothetical protein